MGKRLCRQIRVSGRSRSGIQVFYALDIPVSLKTDLRCSKYLAALSQAKDNFHRKHPGARIDEVRSLTYKEGDHEW